MKGDKGDPGEPGPPGPPGADGGLAGLSCAEGEIVRWNGTAWRCSVDGAGVLPDAFIDPNDCGGGGLHSPCLRAEVDVPGMGVQPEVWPIAGGGRSIAVPSDARSGVELHVEPVALTRPIADGLDRALESTFQIEIANLNLSRVATVDVMPFRVATASGPNGIMPIAAQPVSITLDRRGAPGAYEFRRWWVDYTMSGNPNHMRIAHLSLLDAGLVRELRGWTFEACLPVAWWPTPSGETLRMRCDWSAFSMHPSFGILSVWLTEVFAETFLLHDVELDVLEQGGSTPLYGVTYRRSFLSGYVFPRFDAQSTAPAIETLFFQPDEVDIR